MKVKINGWAKLAFTILFTIFFGTVCIIGLQNGNEKFTNVFTAMIVIEMMIVRDLFKNGHVEIKK